MEREDEVVESRRRTRNRSLFEEVGMESQKTYEKVEIGKLEDRVNEKEEMAEMEETLSSRKCRQFRRHPSKAARTLAQMNVAGQEQLHINHPVPVAHVPSRVPRVNARHNIPVEKTGISTLITLAFLLHCNKHWLTQTPPEEHHEAMARDARIRQPLPPHG